MSDSTIYIKQYFCQLERTHRLTRSMTQEWSPLREMRKQTMQLLMSERKHQNPCFPQMSEARARGGQGVRVYRRGRFHDVP